MESAFWRPVHNRESPPRPTPWQLTSGTTAWTAHLTFRFLDSVMADKTFLGGATLGMAIHTETHVELVYRHHPIHGLDRPMTLLALYAGPDMGFVHEAHEIRQRVHPVPPDLERRLLLIHPRPRHR